MNVKQYTFCNAQHANETQKEKKTCAYKRFAYRMVASLWNSVKAIVQVFTSSQLMNSFDHQSASTEQYAPILNILNVIILGKLFTVLTFKGNNVSKASGQDIIKFQRKAIQCCKNIIGSFI